MIAVIFDNVSDKNVINKIKKYDFVILINTKNKATKLYSLVKRKTKHFEIKINIDNLDMLEELAVNIAKTFAKSNKEPIHLYIYNKCIVY